MRYIIGLIFSLFVFSRVQADDVIVRSLLGPTTSGIQVVISSGGASIHNCLSFVSVVSTATGSDYYSFRVSNGGVDKGDIFNLLIPSATVFTSNWPRASANALCGAANSQMTIAVSAGAYSINYTGFTYKEGQ